MLIMVVKMKVMMMVNIKMCHTCVSGGVDGGVSGCMKGCCVVDDLWDDVHESVCNGVCDDVGDDLCIMVCVTQRRIGVIRYPKLGCVWWIWPENESWSEH